MTKTLRTLLTTAVAALLACSPLMYGKIDAPSVAVTNTIPGTIPGYIGPALTVPVDLIPSFTFTVGEVTVDESSKDSSIKLNSAAITITTPDPTIKLDGIQAADLTLIAPGGAPKSVAKYDVAAKIGSISADGKTLTLAPTSDLELLGFLSNQTLTVKIGGSGTPPSKAWNGEVTLDFHVIAQKNIL
jgi:hypothetical protein